MKLYGIVSAFALLTLVALSSCKKNYTCACTTTTTAMVLDFSDTTGSPIFKTTTDTLTSTETYNTTKNDAKDRCSDKTQNYHSSDSVNVKVVQDCDLR